MLALLAATALGGSLYVNGVLVDGLRNQTFSGCEVLIDAKGNIHVTAPGYHIEVVDPAPSRRSRRAAAAAPLPAAPPPPPISDLPEADLPTAPRSSSLQGGLVAAGQWWLLTEDAGSGHQVKVYVNGARVLSLESGAGSAVRDLAGWLRPGDNTVRVESTSYQGASGGMAVLLAPGEDRMGAIILEEPRVRFSTAGASGSLSREYILTVQ